MNPHPSTTTTTLKITKNLVKVGLNHPPPRFLTTNTPLKNGCSGGVRTPIQTMTTEPMERNVYTPRILSNYSADWNADTVLNVDFLRGWGVTWITGFVQPGYWRGNKNEHPITGSKWQKNPPNCIRECDWWQPVLLCCPNSYDDHPIWKKTNKPKPWLQRSPHDDYPTRSKHENHPY